MIILKWLLCKFTISAHILIFIFSENPCLITFEKPAVVKENNTVTLTCSTLSSCPSNPQIENSTDSPLQEDTKQKTTTFKFEANWRDDGKTFSCQTQDNKDEHLIRNVSLTVECKFLNAEFIYVASTIWLTGRIKQDLTLQSKLSMFCDVIVWFVNPAVETGLHLEFYWVQTLENSASRWISFSDQNKRADYAF